MRFLVESKRTNAQGWNSAELTTPRVALSRALSPDWLMTLKFRWSIPRDDGFMKVDAKEGSFPPTTEFLARPLPTPGPLELPACSASSPKWASTSSMVRAESGSREMGGISNSSSPKLGVWNVCYGGGKDIQEKLVYSKLNSMQTVWVFMHWSKSQDCTSDERKWWPGPLMVRYESLPPAN